MAAMVARTLYIGCVLAAMLAAWIVTDGHPKLAFAATPIVSGAAELTRKLISFK